MFKVLCFLLLALSVGAVPKGSLTGASQVIIPEAGVDYSSFNLASNVLGSLARDAEIITPTDAPDYGLTSYTNQPYMLFFLGDYVIIKGEIIPLTAYSFPDMVVTEPTTNYPAGFAAFAPTVTNRTPYVGSPEIAEWTRQNDPGDTMALTGEELDGDFAGFYYYSEDAVGFGDIQRLDSQQAAVTMPDNLTEDDFYLMWPMNNNGFGEPVGINQTEAWWVGPDLVATGETFSVYGQNLDLGDGLASAYIEGYGWITNTAANPYKVDFEVPTTLTNGTYTIYAHNGHGEKYGWSDPLTFDVEDPIIWDEDTNNWFDVTDYGAVGDGVTDDSDAIFTAANVVDDVAYRTLYFPAGTYLLTKRVYTANGSIRYKGAGMDVTIIQGGDTSTDGYNTLLMIKQNSVVEDLEINKGDADNTCLIAQQGGGQRENIRLNRVRLSSASKGAAGDSTGAEPLNLLAADNFVATDCEFIINFGIVASTAENIHFRGCSFLGTGDSNGFMSYAGNKMSLVDCFASPLDATDKTISTGWGKGRWVYGGPWKNVYIGDNISSNMAPRYADPFYSATPIAVSAVTTNESNPLLSTQTLTFTDLPEIHGGEVQATYGETRTRWGKPIVDWDVDADTVTVSGYPQNFVEAGDTNMTVVFFDIVDQNSGEQFLVEGAPDYSGSPSSVVNSTNLVFSDLTKDLSGKMFMITDGTGIGQTAIITEDSTSTGTVKLVTPLRVLPNATSVCKLGGISSRIVQYNNQLDGTDLSGTADFPTATTALSIYSGGSRVVADGNTASRMGSGYALWSSVSDDAYGMPPNLFNVLKNNTIEGCQNGIVQNVMDWNYTVATEPCFFGHVFRGNSISNSTESAFTTSTSDGDQRKDLCVYDSNTTASNVVVFGDSESSVQYNQVYVGNMFTGYGSDTGLVFSATNSPALHGNTWTGFATNYVGNVPGAILEVPIRSFFTNTAEQTASVFNSGTADLIWTNDLGDGGTITAEGSDTFSFTFGTATNFTVSGGGGSFEVYVLDGGLGTPVDGIWSDYTNAVVDTSTYNTALNSIADLTDNPTNITWDVGSIKYSYAGYYAQLKLIDELGWTLDNGGLSTDTDDPEVYLNLGPELITNGTFASGGGGWTPNANAAFSVVDGEGVFERVSSGAVVNFTPVSTEVAPYLASVDVIDGIFNTVRISATDSLNGSSIMSNSGVGSYAAIKTGYSGTSYMGWGRGANGTSTLDNFSLRKILAEDE